MLQSLRKKVKEVGNKLGLDTKIQHIENPRIEDEQLHYYNLIHEKLYQLGFKARHKLEEELEIMLTDLSKYKHRLIAKQDQILPKVGWKD